MGVSGDRLRAALGQCGGQWSSASHLLFLLLLHDSLFFFLISFFLPLSSCLISGLFRFSFLFSRSVLFVFVFFSFCHDSLLSLLELFYRVLFFLVRNLVIFLGVSCVLVFLLI